MASYFQHHASPQVWDYLEQMGADWTHESSFLSNDTAKAGELTWGSQLDFFPKQKPASARPRSLKREPSDVSRGYRSEFLTRRDSVGRGRSVSGSSFSSMATSSGQSCSPTRHDGPTDLSSVIQNLSSQLGFDLNETFNCAKKYSKPVKSAQSTPTSTPVAASPKIKAAKPSSVRHEFVVQVPHVQKPATTVEYDTMMSAMNAPIAVAEPKTACENAQPKGAEKQIKRTRKVSFAEAIQELPAATEPETEPEMILDDGVSDSESDSDSVPDAVFLNVEMETPRAPRVRHVEIRDAEEEEKDYITIYHC
ncbi:uncharacterized protein GIQ15_03937 [Arthroderma uncinatum]|uniref:uncharacterized protein n=1 Tax=Arthroderma uncinatum TaxID=74035 RepID=UPI00144A4DA9|nr:uncharacterized protein GIQ15_03937 [Arthroderma uncinatum]KAF3481178.1 hypothetical protein GIQ15_03937 [Arthroderma uncinatum]